MKFKWHFKTFDDRNEWHSHFALIPRKVGDDQYVWLWFIQRRNKHNHSSRCDLEVRNGKVTKWRPAQTHIEDKVYEYRLV